MGLDDATQEVADELQVPVVVFDTDMRVLAFSKHESSVDSARKDIIVTGRGTAKSVEMIAQYHVGSARQPVRLPAVDEVPGRILVPLRHNERLVGYLSCVDVNDHLDFVPAELELLEIAAGMLGDLVAVRSFDEFDGRERSRELLERLVNASHESRSAAAKEAIDGGYLARADDYSILVLDDSENSDHSLPRSRLALEEATAEVLRSFDGDALGAVLPNAGSLLVLPRALDRAKLDRILSKPTHGAIRSGEGNRQRLSELFESHRQAKIALRYSKLDPQQASRSAVWSELGLDSLLIQLPLESLSTQDLPRALQIILGAPNSAVLLHTMDTYLQSGGDAKETARRLMIHRSTLYYRLDKVKSLTALDLNDGNARRELHTGLRIAELAGFLTTSRPDRTQAPNARQNSESIR